MKYEVITAMVLAAAMTMAGCAAQGAAPKQEAAQAEAVQETEQNSEAPAEETAENSGTPAEEPAKDAAAGENGGVAADGKYTITLITNPDNPAQIQISVVRISDADTKS